MATNGRGRVNVEDWTVLIETEVAKDEPMERWVDDLLDLLEGTSPVASTDPGRVAVTLSTPSHTVEEAVSEMSRRVIEGLDKVGLKPVRIVHVEVMTVTEMDRRLSEPTFPVLVGVAEIAEILGVSRQRVSELARSEQFPRPVAELAAGPVWTWNMLQRFLDTWPRRPGRRKVEAADKT